MYEARGNAGEQWGVSCPSCGDRCNGVERSRHAELVEAAEMRGVEASSAIVEKLSAELTKSDALVKSLQWTVAFQRKALQLWAVARWVWALWVRMQGRKLTP